MELMLESSIYARISLMRPRPGQRERALALLSELIDFYAIQPGYLDAYTLTCDEGADGDVGRITLWRDDRDADRVATTPHVLALRADLLRCVEDGSDVERGFTAKAGPLGALICA
jgi:quinol monooxygenase YgiN